MKHLILTALSLFAHLVVHAAEPPAAEAAGRWSADKANQWYDSQPWPCGFNYVPAHAISYTEMWMPDNFDVAKMDKELALAEDAGFKTPCSPSSKRAASPTSSSPASPRRSNARPPDSPPGDETAGGGPEQKHCAA